ncbi:MAG: 16S rRNA (guanine(527)-N(7))-methyltransferase RsmG [Hydrogenophilales bacterium]|nr:16S rRNA (guanine(527)-N(7))-methyltransferase RsmG [Hydrogenophilales bacterium]
MSLSEDLVAGLAALGVPLDTAQQQKLLDYIALIVKWNKVYNLTAVREPEAMIAHHLLDSLAVLPHLSGARRLIDVGSGAGLPGIPLAIARPDMNVVLLDSNHKKATFMRQACLELGLANAEVVCERVEKWQPQDKFDAVISRAYSELKEFVRLSAHLAAKGGKLYAMKGLYPVEEIAQLAASAKVEAVIALTVPGLEAQRHLVMMKLA